MHKLRYMALGGLLMFIGMLTAIVLMPSLVAQRDKFEEIECTKLTVVDADGKACVVLYTNPSDEPRNPLTNLLDGGYVKITNKDGTSEVGLGVSAGYDPRGYVYVMGKDEELKVWLGVSEHGNGTVSIWDKNGNRQ